MRERVVLVLPLDLGEIDGGDAEPEIRAGGDEVVEEVSDADGRELVRIANEDELALWVRGDVLEDLEV